MPRLLLLVSIALDVAFASGCTSPSADSHEPSEAVLEGPRTPASCVAAERGGQRYAFCVQRLSFEEAARACEAAGMALAVIDGDDENELVGRGVPASAYIGLTDRAQEGVWRWQADQRVTWCGDATGRPDHPGAYAAWARGAPSQHSDTADCAVLHPDHRWTSEDCSEPRPFVCETVPPGAELSFAEVATRIRGDARSGGRRVDSAQLQGEVSATAFFARFPESLGLRACVDSFVPSGVLRELELGFEAQDFEQTYRGIPVYTRGYSVRQESGTGYARAITGPAAHEIDIDVAPAISEHAAYARALAAVGGEGEGEGPPRSPGRLVVFPEGFGPGPRWRLAWIFTVHARQRYTVAIGADVADVLMVSGERRG